MIRWCCPPLVIAVAWVGNRRRRDRRRDVRWQIAVGPGVVDYGRRDSWRCRRSVDRSLSVVVVV